MATKTPEQEMIFRCLRGQIDRWMAASYPVPQLGKSFRLQFSHLNFYRRRNLQVGSVAGDLVDNPVVDSNAGLILEVRFGDEKFSTKTWGSNGQMPLGNNERALEKMTHYEYDVTIKQALGRYLKSMGHGIFYMDGGSVYECWANQPGRTYIDEPQTLDPSGTDIETTINMVNRASAKSLERRPDLFRSFACMQLATSERFYLDSEGSEIYTSNTGGSFNIDVNLRRQDGRMQSAGNSYFAGNLSEIVQGINLDTYCQEILDRLQVLENAELEPSGNVTVVLGPEAFGLFLHEAVLGHLLSAEYIDGKVSTIFADSMDKRICPQFLTVYDDPTIEGALGSYKYDYEGIPAMPTLAIENGVLRGFLNTRATAAKRGIRPRGNSRGEYAPTDNNVELIRHAYEPRSSNITVHIDPGAAASPADLIREAHKARDKRQDYILFVEGRAGAVNPQDGTFRLMPYDAVRIYEDGRTVPVTDIELLGDPHTMLESIIKCGDQYKTSVGICGARSGRVPVSSNCPSALIKGMRVVKLSNEQYTEPLLAYGQ